MKPIAKLLAPAGLALCAMAAAPVAAQIQGGIATVDVSRTILSTNALQNAYNAINTTYAQQIELRRVKTQERQTLLQSFDTNGDQEVDDAELAAKEGSPELAQLQTISQEIAQLSNQVDGARIYAIEQILAQYAPALQEVVTQRQINLVLQPEVIVFAAEQADITPQVTVSLNAKVPSVQTVPPADWRPSRQGAQLFQDIQQTLATAQLIQQRQQAVQQQQGNTEAPVGR